MQGSGVLCLCVRYPKRRTCYPMPAIRYLTCVSGVLPVLIPDMCVLCSVSGVWLVGIPDRVVLCPVSCVGYGMAVRLAL